MNAPLIIAHRGARNEFPENSIAAFRRAIELGADGIELDTLLTSDNVPVVTHNNDLSILTGFKGLAHNTPYSKIQALGIPTLTEVLETVAPLGILTIVEIKAQGERHRPAAEIIGREVAKANVHGPVVVSSFSPRVLYWLARIHPNIPRAFIIGRGRFPVLRSHLIGRLCRISEIHIGTRALSRRLVRAAKKRGWQTDAWTVNTAKDIELCLKMGIDGFITDNVAFVQGYFRNLNSNGCACKRGSSLDIGQQIPVCR